MRTSEDIVQGLKHNGYHFVCAVRKGPDEFPRFIVFEDDRGQRAVIMVTAYEQGELFLPADRVGDGGVS
jgi:hypothetical protein